jgi:hypothetical protein
MKGYISSWKSGDDSVTSCPGDVFPFDLDGVSDSELSQFLKRSRAFSDPGPCAGEVSVRFAVQGGFALDIQRLQAQVSFQELNATPPGTQALRAVNRIPFSSGALHLDQEAPLAGQISAGLQIHHPKGSKALNSVLRFSLSKPKNARVVLTVQSGDKTTTTAFPFGKSVNGNKKLKLHIAPQAGMAGVHHVSVHGFVQRKDSNARVRLNLNGIDVSSRSSRRV